MTHINYQDIIYETASKHYNVAEKYKDNTVEENVNICKNNSLPFSVGTINITGELNIGMMIRSACLFGAEKFYTFGRKKYDRRSTVGAENYIDIVQYTYDAPIHADESILHDLIELKKNTGCDVVICEQGGYELGTVDYEYVKQSFINPIFIFGSESFGVPEIIMENSRFHKVSIPQRGVLRSFNVSAAMNIIAWDYIKEKHL